MALLVIAECIDIVTGDRLMPGQPFPGGRPSDQVARLMRSGCVRDADLAEMPPLVAETVLAAGEIRKEVSDAHEATAAAGRIAHGEEPARGVKRGRGKAKPSVG